MQICCTIRYWSCREIKTKRTSYLPWDLEKPLDWSTAHRLIQNPGIRYIATGKLQEFSGSDLANCRINLNSGVILQVPPRVPLFWWWHVWDITRGHNDYTLRSIGPHLLVSLKISCVSRYLAMRIARALCHSEHTTTVDPN